MENNERRVPSLSDKYPSNTHKEKKPVEEPKKIEKVIRGTVITKKKSFGRKLSEMFFGDDVGSVSQYIIHDVLLPAAKSTLSDMVSGGIEMLLFGESRGSRTRRDKGKSYVSYGSYYRDRDRDRDRRDASPRNRSRHNFDDIIVETRGDAEEVLSQLVDQIEDYGMASVSDLYDLVGITPTFTDEKYGWTNLSTAYVDRVRNGYLIRLPKTVVLD